MCKSSEEEGKTQKKGGSHYCLLEVLNVVSCAVLNCAARKIVGTDGLNGITSDCVSLIHGLQGGVLNLCKSPTFATKKLMKCVVAFRVVQIAVCGRCSESVCFFFFF
jgi:hypothetical protein